MKIVALYLAAGASTRMGMDKRLLPYNGVPLGSIALKNALLSKLDHTLVITRKGDSFDFLPVPFFLSPLAGKWSQVACEEASHGISYSIRYGLKRAIEMEADAILILLADQPFVTTNHINKLVDSYQNEPHNAYIAAENRRTPMPPILFSRQCFSILLQLKGDQGARSAIRDSLLCKGKMIDYKDSLLFYDVDTAEDYSALLK